MPRKARPPIHRVLAKTAAGPDGCVIYTGRLCSQGYGITTAPNGRSSARVHRIAYEHFIGPIPAGAHLDHVCHTESEECPGGIDCLHRRCLNPYHLEPVTPAENNLRSKSISSRNARKSHCQQGHPYDEANTRFERDGGRRCKKCASSKRSGARRRQRDRERRESAALLHAVRQLVDALYLTDARIAETVVAQVVDELGPDLGADLSRVAA